VSVAGVVLANGLNANQMHRWMRERGIAPPSWRKPACAERTGLVAQPGFVPVQDAPSVEPPVIRLEAQRGKARSRAVAWGLRPAVGQNGSFCLIMPCHAPKRPRRQPTHGRQQAAKCCRPVVQETRHRNDRSIPKPAGLFPAAEQEGTLRVA